MKNKATISGDIISFTSLIEIDKRKLDSEIHQLLGILSEKYKSEGFYGRNIQGDYIECAIRNPKSALRIALLIKTFIKSRDIPDKKKSDKRATYFVEHGIRLAVAVAPLKTLDPEKGIIDGDAIYRSGRTIKGQSTAGKKKIIIKHTMFFYHPEDEVTDTMETVFSLLDVLLSKCSGKQSEVVFFKLLGLSEKEISKKLGRSQSTISQHSNAAGWQAIEKSVRFFENYIQ
ncbi:MAG: helix-turn-helix transcriptional regulator [Bacteroidota bacterium]